MILTHTPLHLLYCMRMHNANARLAEDAGQHLAPACFVEVQLLGEVPALASGKVGEVYNAPPGQQPVVALQDGQVGAVRPTHAT